MFSLGCPRHVGSPPVEQRSQIDGKLLWMLSKLELRADNAPKFKQVCCDHCRRQSYAPSRPYSCLLPQRVNKMKTLPAAHGVSPQWTRTHFDHALRWHVEKSVPLDLQTASERKKNSNLVPGTWYKLRIQIYSQEATRAAVDLRQIMMI